MTFHSIFSLSTCLHTFIHEYRRAQIMMDNLLLYKLNITGAPSLARWRMFIMIHSIQRQIVNEYCIHFDITVEPSGEGSLYGSLNCQWRLINYNWDHDGMIMRLKEQPYLRAPFLLMVYCNTINFHRFPYIQREPMHTLLPPPYNSDHNKWKYSIMC